MKFDEPAFLISVERKEEKYRGTSSEFAPGSM